MKSMIPPRAADQGSGMFEKLRRIGPAPLRIAGREMRADIAFGNRAEQRVGDGVKRNIGVAVAGQAAIMRNQDAAQPQLLALGKPVDVESRRAPHAHAPRHDAPRQRQSPRGA